MRSALAVCWHHTEWYGWMGSEWPATYRLWNQMVALSITTMVAGGLALRRDASESEPADGTDLLALLRACTVR